MHGSKPGTQELRGGFRRETAVFHKAEADLALTVDALAMFRSSPEFLSIIHKGCYDKQGVLSIPFISGDSGGIRFGRE